VTIRIKNGRNLARSVSSFALFAAMTVAASAQQFDRAIIFGDSLSDQGNLASVSPGGLNPAYPAGLGLTRFSNGTVWTDQLFGPASLFISGANPNVGNVNYAFGGSRTTGAQTPGPTTQEQIGAYIARGGRFTSSNVVTLWAGANNIFQGLPAAAGDPTTAQAVMTGVSTGAAGDVATQVRTIAGAGAGTILVANLPGFATVPQFAGTTAAPLAGASTSAFNAALSAQLAGVAAQNPGTNIMLVDAAALFTAVQANPAAFGLANATQACLLTPACANNPAIWNTYAFWDGVHPTQAGYAIFAGAAREYLAGPSRAAAISTALGFSSYSARRTATLDAFSRLASLTPQPGQWAYFADLTGEAGQAKGNFSNGPLAAAGFTSGTAREYRLAGLRVGGLRDIGNGWTLGAMASFSTGTIDGLRGKFETGATHISGDLLARWRNNAGVFAHFNLGASIDRYTGYEYRTIANLTNTGSTGGNAISAGVEIGRDYKMGAFTVTPQLRAQYLRSTVDAFNEAGVVAPIAFGSRTVQTLALAPELKFSTTLGNGASAFALIGYEGHVAKDFGSARGSLTGIAFTPSGDTLGKLLHPGLQVGLGVQGQLGGLTARATYRGSFGSSSQMIHSGTIGVSGSF
jgi:outer membrane lipase/esterase